MTYMTNNAGLGLAVSVWLAHDTYTNGAELFPGREVISATTLLKSTRQFILSKRLTQEDKDENPEDVTDQIAAQMGRAIHDSIEDAWKNGYAGALQRLGYPKKVIERVRINPDPNTVVNGDFPVYLEQRGFREIDVAGQKLIISGQFDAIINGELNDTKTTSVWSYVKGSKQEDYTLQGSIYRWIEPKLITSDVMRIQHVFTDWQRAMVKSTPNYPAQRVIENRVELMDPVETGSWIHRKVNEIRANMNLDEKDIIPCSDKELWMSAPQYKYYSKPETAAAGGRATRVFDNYPEAAAHMAGKGKGKGVIKTIPGEPKACAYCPAFSICTQKDQYEWDK